MSVTYTTAHSNARSLTHWVRPGIEPMSSWILVGFITTEPWQELVFYIFSAKISHLCTHFDYIFYWSIVDLQGGASFCCTAKWLSLTYIYIYMYIYIYTFSKMLFSTISIPRDWRWFPGLYSRTLFFIHSKCNSVHLLAPNSKSSPLSPSPQQPQVCSLCMWVYFFFVDLFINAIFY